jgi:hypothetical protein
MDSPSEHKMSNLLVDIKGFNILIQSWVSCGKSIETYKIKLYILNISEDYHNSRHYCVNIIKTFLCHPTDISVSNICHGTITGPPGSAGRPSFDSGTGNSGPPGIYGLKGFVNVLLGIQ